MNHDLLFRANQFITERDSVDHSRENNDVTFAIRASVANKDGIIDAGIIVRRQFDLGGMIYKAGDSFKFDELDITTILNMAFRGYFRLPDEVSLVKLEEQTKKVYARVESALKDLQNAYSDLAEKRKLLADNELLLADRRSQLQYIQKRIIEKENKLDDTLQEAVASRRHYKNRLRRSRLTDLKGDNMLNSQQVPTEKKVVHFVLDEGLSRGRHCEATITRVWRRDNDDGKGPVPLESGQCELLVHGYTEDKIRLHERAPLHVKEALKIAVFDQAGGAGTWHWPE